MPHTKGKTEKIFQSVFCRKESQKAQKKDIFLFVSFVTFCG